MWLLYALIVLLAIFLVIRRYIYGNDDYWPSRGVPYVQGGEVASFWDRALIRIPFHEMDYRMYNALKSKGCGAGAAAAAPFGGFMELRNPHAFIIDPDLIKNVLVKDFDNFTNRRAFGPREDPTLFGKMLINMESREWKDTRSAMSPTFTTGKIRRMHAIFTESSARIVNFIRQEIGIAGAGAELDLQDACSRFTMDVVASSAFGIDSNVFEDKNALFSRMGKRFLDQFKGSGIFRMFVGIFLPALFSRLGLSMFEPTTFKFFSEMTKRTMEHRKRTGERRQDFLQLLLDARDGQLTAEDDDEAMLGVKGKVSAVEWTDDLILAQSLLFFLAGFDTTESLLMFALYELALNPEIQERLASELEEIGQSGLTFDAVNHHEYLDMVISETLRKHPPGGRPERKCAREYQVPGTSHRLPAGQIIGVPIYAIHHDPEYYPEPQRFDPERFTSENKKKRNPYTYMPFSLGPRMCIAQRFAIMEGKTAIAHLVRNFRIEPCSKTTIPMEYAISPVMKPKHGMWLKLSLRKN